MSNLLKRVGVFNSITKEQLDAMSEEIRKYKDMFLLIEPIDDLFNITQYIKMKGDK